MPIRLAVAPFGLFRGVLRLALLSIAFTWCGVAQAQAPGRARWAAAVDSMTQQEMLETGTPGAQIAIVRRGRLIHSAAHGVADVASGRRVTPRTLFHTGSVTKTVTAALLAQLAAGRLIDLQAPVSRYVTELSGRRVGTVTTHQLLTHSAGWGDAGNAFGSSDEAALGMALTALGDTIVMTAPGQIYSYSNPGFAMAGYVAERAARRGYAALVDSVVLRPLGMTGSTFRSARIQAADVALGHAGRPGAPPSVQPRMPDNAAEWPAGFLLSTADELARFAMALMSGGILDGRRVLAADAVRSMTTGYVPDPGAPTALLGYGLRVDTAGGRTVWQKNGMINGYESLLTIWPEEQLAVVVLANRASGLPPRVTRLAAQLVGGIEPAPPPAQQVGTRGPTHAEREQLLGSYRNRTFDMVLADVGGELEARFRSDRVRVRLTADGSRLVGEVPNEAARVFLIVRDEGGRVRYLYSSSGRVWAKQEP